MSKTQGFDVVIIGSGVGGGATALRLARSGLSIALVERGTFLPREPENWDADAVFREGRYGLAAAYSIVIFFVIASFTVFNAVATKSFKEAD